MYHIEIAYSSTTTSNGTLPVVASYYYYSGFSSTLYSDILFTINGTFYLKAI